MAGRRMVAAGVALTAVVGGGIAGAVLGVPGLSGASTSTTTTMPAQAPRPAGPFGREFGEHDLLDAAAKALHLSTSRLLDDLSDGKTTIADVAKAQHVDVQTVVDAMDAAAQHDISDIVNQPFPAFPKLGPLGGPDGKGRFRPPLGAGPGFGDLRKSADAVAKALGISTSELFSDLRSGQSIADIAKAKHVDVSGIVTLLVNDAKSQLEAAVKDGKLTRDRASSIESNLQQRITQAVNGSFPMRFGAHRHGLRFGGRGSDGFDGFGGPGGPPGAPAPGTGASSGASA